MANDFYDNGYRQAATAEKEPMIPPLSAEIASSGANSGWPGDC